MELTRRGAGSRAELITQTIAQIVVDDQGLGEIVLGGERLHEVPIAALP